MLDTQHPTVRRNGVTLAAPRSPRLASALYKVKATAEPVAAPAPALPRHLGPAQIRALDYLHRWPSVDVGVLREAGVPPGVAATTIDACARLARLGMAVDISTRRGARVFKLAEVARGWRPVAVAMTDAMVIDAVRQINARPRPAKSVGSPHFPYPTNPASASAVSDLLIADGRTKRSVGAVRTRLQALAAAGHLLTATTNNRHGHLPLYWVREGRV